MSDPGCGASGSPPLSGQNSWEAQVDPYEDFEVCGYIESQDVWTGEWLSLDHVATLDSVSACRIAKHGGGLSLNGLSELAPEVARELANHRGAGLSLSGLKMISTEAALTLARYKGALILDGLEVLPVNLASALKHHTGRLQLNSVRWLSEDQSNELAQHEGRLSLGGLTILTNHALAARLLGPGFGQFDSLTTISSAAARTLAGHQAGLSFKGLKILTADVAAALVKHKHWLHLDGVTAVSPKVARILTQYEGCLSLNGLRELPLAMVSELVRHKGGLFLNGLETLTYQQAKILADYKGQVSVGGLVSLTEDAARCLRSRGVHLPGSVHIVTASHGASHESSGKSWPDGRPVISKPWRWSFHWFFAQPKSSAASLATMILGSSCGFVAALGLLRIISKERFERLASVLPEFLVGWLR
jgi:hypothetical protein